MTVGSGNITHICTEAKTLGKILAHIENLKNEQNKLIRKMESVEDSLSGIEQHIYNGMTENLEKLVKKVDQYLIRPDDGNGRPVERREKPPIHGSMSKKQRITLWIAIGSFLIANGLWLLERINTFTEWLIKHWGG